LQTRRNKKLINSCQSQNTDYKIEKRPLLRPAITSTYTNASTPKTIYISSKTPFMSAIKRAQKLLAQAEKRQAQSAADQISKQQQQQRGSKYTTTTNQNNNNNDDISDIERIAAAMAEIAKNSSDEVILRATGKAISKALEMALWFQQRAEYAIRIETGTVGAIDDIVAPDGNAGHDEAMVLDGGGGDDAGIPESRIRYASTIQIFVSPAA
jgi:ribonuclease P/MRP protein subunit POP7